MPSGFNRATCDRCGAEFSPPVFGETTRLCPRCGQELAQVEPAVAAAIPPTPITRALVLANVTVFVIMVLARVSPVNPSAEALIHWGGNFGPLTLAGEPWRIFSAMFLHVGLIHLALNMWVLWDIGRLLELVLGRWTFLLTYLLCGTGSSVFSVWWKPVPVKVGASGAIFGVAGVLLAIAYLQSQQGAKDYLRHHLRSLGAFVMYNLLFGALSPGIDNAGHVGGLLAGLVIGSGLTVGRGRRSVRYATFLVAGVLAAGLFLAAQQRHRGWIRLVAAHEEMRAGNRQSAVRELQQAVAADPALADAYFDLGYIRLEEEKYEVAAAAFRKAVELEPAMAEAHVNLGLAYLRLEKLDEAENALKNAIGLAPGDARAHYLLGLVYYDRGRDAEAAQKFAAALQIAPAYSEARRGLDEVTSRQKAQRDAALKHKRVLPPQ